MTLEFNVINQKITSKCNNYHVVADSINYLKIDFNFTVDWQDFNKLITFRNGIKLVTIPFDESCIVPWEVIKSPSFMFSIVGKKDDVTITTDTMKVIVKPSGEQNGCSPTPPIKPIWEGLQGGFEGQVLTKESDENYDYIWKDLKDSFYDREHSLKEVIESKERAYCIRNEDTEDEEEDTYTLVFTNDAEE